MPRKRRRLSRKSSEESNKDGARLEGSEIQGQAEEVGSLIFTKTKTPRRSDRDIQDTDGQRMHRQETVLLSVSYHKPKRPRSEAAQAKITSSGMPEILQSADH